MASSFRTSLQGLEIIYKLLDNMGSTSYFYSNLLDDNVKQYIIVQYNKVDNASFPKD